MSRIQLPDCWRLTINQTNNNDDTMCQHEVIVNFFDAIVNFSYWSKFHVNIIPSSGVMTISVYKRLTRNREIGKSEISPSKFDPIYGDWGELEIPNLAQLSPMKCYWILQDARVTAFTVSELLRENHQEGWGGGGVKLPLPSPPRLELNWWMHIILPESGYDIGLPHRSSWYE